MSYLKENWPYLNSYFPTLSGQIPLSLYLYNKHISPFSVQPDFAFVSYICCIYAWFAIYCIILLHCPPCWNFWCRHTVNTNLVIILTNKWFCKKYFLHKHCVPKGFYLYKYLFLRKIKGWGCGSQNWTFKLLHLYHVI